MCQAVRTMKENEIPERAECDGGGGYLRYIVVAI